MKEIRRIIHLYDQLKADGTPAALAIVVNVAESSYRRIGARLLVATDGRYVGGISGGCLEGDALRRARAAILSGKPAVHTYDTLDGEDAVIGIGLGCEGRIEVLFVPLNYADADNEVETLRELTDIRSPRLLLRLLNAYPGRSFYANLFTPDDLRPIWHRTQMEEKNVRALLNDVLRSGRSRVREFPGEREFLNKLLVEVLHPEIHLVLTGTNYDIPPTLAAGRNLGWRTTVIGAQRKFTKAITGLADQVLDYSEADKIQPDTATAVVLMSHDFDWDQRMVRYFLPLRPVYFGMLGPKKRAAKMDEILREDGLDLLGYPNLYSPVGLDVGAETPEEIAASLTAEIIAVFRGRAGGMLREREATIHGRG